jgi:hypothetical protein
MRTEMRHASHYVVRGYVSQSATEPGVLIRYSNREQHNCRFPAQSIAKPLGAQKPV